VTDFTGIQIVRNRQTQDEPSFSAHREHLMRLISEAVAGLSGRASASPLSDERPTITVIGAGNCQDIDLLTLATSFREIRLVDIDAVAIDNAVSQLTPFVISRTRVFAPIGIAALLMSRQAFEQLHTSLHSAFLAELESAAECSTSGSVANPLRNVVDLQRRKFSFSLLRDLREASG